MKLVAESLREWENGNERTPLNETWTALEALWNKEVDKTDDHHLKVFIRRIFDLTNSKVWRKMLKEDPNASPLNRKFEMALNNMSHDELMEVIEKARAKKYSVRYSIIDPEYSGEYKLSVS